MAVTIEHYSKYVNYVVDVEFENVLYTVHCGTPQGETDPINLVFNAEDASLVELGSDLHNTLIAVAKEEIASQESTDTSQLLAKIGQLSDPLITRDAEELLEAIIAINELVRNH